jgi:double-stranded uracil-DNA glycosylase
VPAHRRILGTDGASVSRIGRPSGAETPFRPLRDRVGPGTRILFVGINPGLRSAALGHHFAGYSNRFWKLLGDAGFVPEGFGFERDAELPQFGLGITNLVARPTPGVSDLQRGDFARGRRRLKAAIARWHPPIVALVGVTVYRELFELRSGTVKLGEQAARLHGARLFVLPNPSGRNAHHPYATMRRAYRALHKASAGAALGVAS